VTSGSVQDFPSFLKDAGEQLERNPARDWDFWQVKLYQHKHAQNENKHNPDC